MSNFSLINKRNIKNSSFYLDEKESHHIISVLRLKKDDELTLTDGEGNSLNYHKTVQRAWEDTPYMGTNYISEGCFLRNRKTGKTYQLTSNWYQFCLLYTSPSPRDS